MLRVKRKPAYDGDLNKAVNEKEIISRITTVGVVGNIILSAFKFFAGIYGKSGAMISDSIHSMSDVFATLIAYIGTRLSKREADAEHPYGHERIECVASLVLGVILLVTGIGIGKIGIENVIFKSQDKLDIPSTIALIAAIISILSKEAMFWYTRYYAKILNSAAFMADAWHHRSDAFSSIGALIGIGGAMLGFPFMDSIATAIICCFIVKVAYDIIKDGIKKMLDTSCGKEYDNRIVDFVTLQCDVVCVDLIHSRMFGNKVYIDLEIQIDSQKSFKEAHQISENVHKKLEENFPDIKNVMVHFNPSEI